MSPPPIADVSDTAFWVAALREVESHRPDALFHDPMVSVLVEGRGRSILNRIGDDPSVSWAIAVRTVVIDELLMGALVEGCDTVLSLGAGLDTRPYRLPLSPELRWVEIDFPATIQFKEARMRGIAAACRVERRGLDLSDMAARRGLFAELGSESRRVLILTEGILPYLTNEMVASLAKDLHQQASFATWIVDHVTRRFLLATRLMKHGRVLREAPLRFDPGDWAGSFAAWGWKVGQLCPLGYAGTRLGRPLVLPGWLRPIYPHLPARLRHEIMTAGGYARLERR